jgi:hypothetical protein
MNDAELMDERVKALLAVADAAGKWWLDRRPTEWRKERHLKSPLINLSGGRADHKLALAVAKWKELGG